MVRALPFPLASPTGRAGRHEGQRGPGSAEPRCPQTGRQVGVWGGEGVLLWSVLRAAPQPAMRGLEVGRGRSRQLCSWLLPSGRAAGRSRRLPLRTWQRRGPIVGRASAGRAVASEGVLLALPLRRGRAAWKWLRPWRPRLWQANCPNRSPLPRRCWQGRPRESLPKGHLQGGAGELPKELSWPSRGLQAVSRHLAILLLCSGPSAVVIDS